MKQVAVRIPENLIEEINRLDTLGIARNTGDAIKRALMVTSTMSQTDLFAAILKHKQAQKDARAAVE